MEKQKKMELIQRTFGLRHKLKVLESMKTPETHEEKTEATLARWELEDELKAIEELLDSARMKSIEEKKQILIDGGVKAIKKMKQSKQRSSIAATTSSIASPGLKTRKSSSSSTQSRARSKSSSRKTATRGT